MSEDLSPASTSSIDDLDSFMAELDNTSSSSQMIKSTPVYSLQNYSLGKESVKLHQHQASLDAVDVMAHNMALRDADASHCKVAGLESANSDLSKLNDTLKMQLNSLNASCLEERVAYLNRIDSLNSELADTNNRCADLEESMKSMKRLHDVERSELTIQVDRNQHFCMFKNVTYIICSYQLNEAEEKLRVATSRKTALDEDIMTFRDQLADYEALQLELDMLKNIRDDYNELKSQLRDGENIRLENADLKRANAELLSFRDQLIGYEKLRLDYEQLKIANAELTKLTAENKTHEVRSAQRS